MTKTDYHGAKCRIYGKISRIVGSIRFQLLIPHPPCRAPFSPSEWGEGSSH